MVEAGSLGPGDNPPHVLITAGAPWKGSLKALLPVAGGNLLDRVLEAARGLGAPVVLVGGPRSYADRVEVWLPDAGGGAENFLQGLTRVRPGSACLFCASDLPFVTSAALQAFMTAAEPAAVLNYGVTGRQEFLASYPAARRRFVPLREGAYTGAGVFLLQPEGTLAIAETVRRVFASRKNTLRIAWMLGWRFLWGRLTGSLTLTGLEGRASEVTGVRCRAVPAPACLAYDVDDERDYRYALDLLR